MKIMKLNFALSRNVQMLAVMGFVTFSCGKKPTESGVNKNKLTFLIAHENKPILVTTGNQVFSGERVNQAFSSSAELKSFLEEAEGSGTTTGDTDSNKSKGTTTSSSKPGSSGTNLPTPSSGGAESSGSGSGLATSNVSLGSSSVFINLNGNSSVGATVRFGSTAQKSTTLVSEYSAAQPLSLSGFSNGTSGGSSGGACIARIKTSLETYFGALANSTGVQGAEQAQTSLSSAIDTQVQIFEKVAPQLVCAFASFYECYLPIVVNGIRSFSSDALNSSENGENILSSAKYVSEGIQQCASLLGTELGSSLEAGKTEQAEE
jgi:hypothetical protein